MIILTNFQKPSIVPFLKIYGPFFGPKSGFEEKSDGHLFHKNQKNH